MSVVMGKILIKEPNPNPNLTLGLLYVKTPNPNPPRFDCPLDV